VLVFHSTTDHVVGPASLKLLASALPKDQLEIRELANSYHVATLDNDAEAIFAGSLEFVRRHSRLSAEAAAEPGRITRLAPRRNDGVLALPPPSSPRMVAGGSATADGRREIRVFGNTQGLKASQEEMSRQLAKISDQIQPKTSPPPTQPTLSLRKPERPLHSPQARARPRIPREWLYEDW